MKAKNSVGATDIKIAVVGATGDVGQRVVARLCDLGHTVIATSRSAERLRRIDPRAETAITSVADPDTLAPLLARADRIINIAHASTVERLIPLVAASCERLIIVGSTQRYSEVPDYGADTVRHGEQIFLRSNLRGSILHPTMVYGGDNEQNITRIFALVSRWPRRLPLIWPVPEGGKALVQPVYVDDVVAAIVAAVTNNTACAQIIVVAGPQSITLAEMLRASVALCGRRLIVLPVPTGLLIAVAQVLTFLFKKSPFSVTELQRTREDKAYDIDLLTTQLGVEPRPFADGLRHYSIRHQNQTKLGCREQSADG